MSTLTTTATPLGIDDPRVTTGLFTLRECATYLGAPVTTIHRWARPKDGSPLVTVLSPASARQASVPFVGFTEAFVLSALRRVGVPLQRIRPAVMRLHDEIGRDHALASQRVFTDGAELIFDYATAGDEEPHLTVVRTGQQHFADVIREYLKPITYGDDGWASSLRLPGYETASVRVDPTQAFGQPILAHGGARVEDIVDRFRANDPMEEIADDFGVTRDEVEDVIRVALRINS